MTEEELIYLTLQQLSKSLTTTPENFRLDGSIEGNGFIGPTIYWHFKVEIRPGSYMQDPLNGTRTIIVGHNIHADELTCSIFSYEVNNITQSSQPDSKATMTLCVMPYMNRSYREFRKLIKRLLRKKKEKDYLDYLKRLNNIFPSTHVDELLK